MEITLILSALKINRKRDSAKITFIKHAQKPTARKVLDKKSFG